MHNPWLWLGVLILVLAPWLGLALLGLRSHRPPHLGVKEGRLAPCPDTPNAVSSQAQDAGHRIEPLHFTGAAADARNLVKQALLTLPRTRIITETDDYLHAECTSLIFRFVDDVECWLDKANGFIHLRSASRVGRSDFGVNRRRVESIRQAFAKLQARQ